MGSFLDDYANRSTRADSPPRLSADKLGAIASRTPGLEWRDPDRLMEHHLAVAQNAPLMEGRSPTEEDRRKVQAIERAAGLLPELARSQKIAGYLHDYTPGAPKVTLLVAREDGELGVLKIGDGIHPGEAAQLELLEERGAQVPRVIAHDVVHRPDAPVNWLLLEFIDGNVLGVTSPFVVGEPGLDAEAVRHWIGQAGDFFAKCHQPVPNLTEFPGAVSFREEVGRQLAQSFDQTVRAGLVDRDAWGAWERDFNRLTDQPSAADVLLHGDPAEVNTIKTPQGQLYFLDPVTSTGRRELDWARFASRLHWHGGHSPFDAGELIGTIVETDPTLDIGMLCLAFASDYRLGALPASTREHLGPQYARGLLAAAGSLSDLSRRVEPAPSPAAARQTVLAISHSLHEAERTFEAQRAVQGRSPGHQVAI